jgi:predicted nucleotidyltransferase
MGCLPPTSRQLEISVVGSRAAGTADAASDWDFVLKGGNSRARHSAMRELPSNPNAKKGGDLRPGFEELRGIEVDPERPNIKFKPQQ